MPSLILTYTTPVDDGSGNPGRIYSTPLLGANWTHLSGTFAYTQPWSGAFRIWPGEQFGMWFNRYPQPASPFTAADPNQAYVTTAADYGRIDTNNFWPGMQVTVQLYGDVFTPTGNCQYGTRLKGGAAAVVYITPALIDGWLTARGLTWLAGLFTGLWYTVLRVDDLCGSGPPEIPTIDLSTLEASATTIWKLFQAVAWSEYCECIPGTPSPTPYPPLSPTQPSGWPTAPTFTCSEQDLCTSLVAMRQQLTALQQKVASYGELTTLLQRYSLPMAYIRGATHSNNSAQGTFQTSRLIGIEAHVQPPSVDLKTAPGNPPYIFDLGWMSISDANGILEERRLVRLHQVWLPRLMPTALRFAWYLFPGVVSDFTELQAEP